MNHSSTTSNGLGNGHDLRGHGLVNGGQPPFNLASAAYFGHYAIGTAPPGTIPGFAATSTPVGHGLNLTSPNSASSASSASTSGSSLNSSTSPEDGKGEKMSRSSQYKKVRHLFCFEKGFQFRVTLCSRNIGNVKLM